MPRSACRLCAGATLHAATPPGLTQQLLRLAFGAVFRREEQGKMTPHHFIGAIALDPLGARIPRGDMAGGIEHVDGVVHHRLDQLLVTMSRHI